MFGEQHLNRVGDVDFGERERMVADRDLPLVQLTRYPTLYRVGTRGIHDTPPASAGRRPRTRALS